MNRNEHPRAHAVPADPTPSPVQQHVKDPRKVAAGKARAAQAKAAREAAEAERVAAVNKAARAAATRKPAPVAKPRAKPGPKTRNEPSPDAMVVIAFRGSRAQKKKFGKLGGGEWARGRIDAATVR